MLVLGEKEAESGTITVRSRDKGDLGSAQLDEFIAEISREIKNREKTEA